MPRRQRQSGLTLVELIVAFSIMLILSTIALPLAHVKIQREKERRLRDALSEMRKAIDRYKDMADAGQLGQVDPDTFGYPPSLEVMVEGVPVQSGGGGLGGTGGMGQDSDFGTPASQLGSSRGGGMGGTFGNQGGMGNSSFGGRGGLGNRGGGGLGGSSFGGSRGGMGGGSLGSSSGSGFGSGSRRSGGRNNSGNRGSGGENEEKKVRFLRKIPVDPMTGYADWGMRAVEDDPSAFNWSGSNVFDVYSKSMDLALDGTRYSEW